MKVIWVYRLVLINPYKFMSGYLHFSNSLKDIKDHIQAYITSFKNFFQLMVTVIEENLNPATLYILQ